MAFALAHETYLGDYCSTRAVGSGGDRGLWQVEEQSFEYVTLDDVELTTTITADGTRMYMDWETQEWRELPDEWLKQATVKTDFQRGQTLLNMDASDTEDPNASQGLYSKQVAQQQTVDPVDPRVGEYMHPQRGLMHTYLFENTRNTRIYYDSRVNNWARMPLGWERNVAEVKAMLDEIDVLLPRWKNVNEQMLTLRECNYDLQDTIIFAEINWGYKPGDVSVGLAFGLFPSCLCFTCTDTSSAAATIYPISCPSFAALYSGHLSSANHSSLVFAPDVFKARAAADPRRGGFWGRSRGRSWCTLEGRRKQDSRLVN